MKFSGKICLMIILKVAKNQGFTPSFKKTHFSKNLRGGGVDQIDPSSPVVLGLTHNSYIATPVMIANKKELPNSSVSSRIAFPRDSKLLDFYFLSRPGHGTKPSKYLKKNQGTYFRPSTATNATIIARITARFMLFHFNRCLLA